MASFSITSSLEPEELDFIAESLDKMEGFRLCRTLRAPVISPIGMDTEWLRQMLSQWHKKQAPARERLVLIQALECQLWGLSKKIRTGECRNTQQNTATEMEFQDLSQKGTEKRMLGSENAEIEQPQERYKAVKMSNTGRKKNGIKARNSNKKAHITGKCMMDKPLQKISMKLRTLGLDNAEIEDIYNVVKSEVIESHAQTQQNATGAHHTQLLHGTPLSNHKVTEIKMRDLSRMLGKEWRMVGTYLGFVNAEIEQLLHQYKDVRECIFQMLLEWRNKNGVKATKAKLKKALSRAERADLEDFVDEPDDDD